MAGWTGVTSVALESQTHNTQRDPSKPPTVLLPLFVSLQARDHLCRTQTFSLCSCFEASPWNHGTKPHKGSSFQRHPNIPMQYQLNSYFFYTSHPNPIPHPHIQTITRWKITVKTVASGIHCASSLYFNHFRHLTAVVHMVPGSCACINV